MLDLLFPSRCVLCRREPKPLCLGCLKGLPPAPDLAAPPGFDSFASLLAYEGGTKKVIAAIKFDGRPEVIGLPARVLARLVDWDVDSVTWAPTSSTRRRQRGFDQAEVLARQVAQCIGRPCVPSLRRIGDSGHQTGRSRAERLVGAAFKFAGTRADPEGMGTVLLVDDIRTTGATLCAAGDTLLDAGVSAMTALTLAVTL